MFLSSSSSTTNTVFDIFSTCLTSFFSILKERKTKTRTKKYFKKYYIFVLSSGITQNHDGNDNRSNNEGEEGKSPQNITKRLSDGSENTYQSLGKADDLGDYTYQAIDKSGRTTTGQSDGDKNNNPRATLAPSSTDGIQILTSGDNGSSNINSRQAGFNASHGAEVIHFPSTGSEKVTAKTDDGKSRSDSSPDLSSRRVGNNVTRVATVMATPSTGGDRVTPRVSDGMGKSDGSSDLISQRSGSYMYAAHVTTVTTTSTGSDKVTASGSDGKGESYDSSDLNSRRAGSYMYAAHVTSVTTSYSGTDKVSGSGGDGSNKSGGYSDINSSRVGYKKVRKIANECNIMQHSPRHGNNLVRASNA